jgi:flagellar protein FliO/FliZ
MMLSYRTWLLAIIALCSAPAYAASAPNLDLATTLGSLLLVILVILGMAWMLKKMRLPSMTGQKDFTIKRQIALGTKERMLVVQAGDEQFIVGATSHNIQLIAKLDKPLQDDAPTDSAFAAQFNQLLKKKDHAK